jgi:hypothetical protein
MVATGVVRDSGSGAAVSARRLLPLPRALVADHALHPAAPGRRVVEAFQAPPVFAGAPGVVARIAVADVFAGPPAQGVVAQAAVADVISPDEVDRVRPAVAERDVFTGAGAELVAGRAAVDDVPARRGLDVIVSVARPDPIAALL